MFCPECGTKLDKEALFCPECGTKVTPLQAVETAANGTPCVDNAETVSDEPDIVARGFILTNIQSLSRRLHVRKEMVQDVFNGYIRGMRQWGVRYVLLDASDYTYRVRGFLGGRKHVSLGSADTWADYAAILKDAHDAEVRSGEPESDYLFIIGGDDDVPMPCLPHFFDNDNDRDFDTDLLYAYPYGDEMAAKLLSQELFSYDALFYVGRLPIADDGSFSDLTDYLSRVLEQGAAVPVDTAYSQCDPHWKQVTLSITENLNRAGLYPDYGDNLPAEIIAQKRVFLTPHVALDSQTGKQNPHAFNEQANYYFFNMHGSNAMHSEGFFGEGLHGEGWAEGMSPLLIARAERPNIFFTQACYGGRFIRYPKRKSTLLSALTGKTLTYVGSSRVAYGAVDPSDGQCRLSTSDILAQAFNCAMLNGYTAGAAFFAARVETWQTAPGDVVHALTISEFNLYGDPLVHIGGYQATNYTADKSALLKPGEKVGVVREEVISRKSAPGKQSLLVQVRSAVDKNIMDISASIAASLYRQYGIPAREPSIISRCTYADGRRELCFTFSQPGTNGLCNETRVSASEDGTIKTVASTKLFTN